MVMQRDPIAWFFFYVVAVLAITYILVHLFGFKEENDRNEESESEGSSRT